MKLLGFSPWQLGSVVSTAKVCCYSNAVDLKILPPYAE